jgi:hypothetical protein
VVGAIVILYAWRRRRRGAAPWSLPIDELDRRAIPADSPFANVISGNGRHPFVITVAGQEQATPLGGQPLTIGFGEDCDLRLPESTGVAAMHARIWLRDGRPMLHHLAPGHATMVNGAPADWASISPGDIIEIGPYAMRCMSTTAAEAVDGPAAGSVPG